MRRTQQNADQQRRRGVRSRLVACVAAVAMLVTSVAAGTAVAVELGGGDAADQTTQNTATLEQQGTGNTGDNSQTTTNDDGQADGDQPSDADNVAEPDDAATDEGVTAAGDVASDEFVNSATATGNANGNTVSSTDEATITTAPSVEPLGEPAHSKKIGDNGDGTYTLALDVTGKTQTSGGTTTTPVDVVMIIDRSSSMNEDITTSSETKYMPVKSSNVKGSSADYHDRDHLFDYWTQGDPGGPYYVFVDGEYKRLTEITKDEQHTNYWYQQQIFKVHDSWVVDGKEYDPTITTFYTQHNSSSTMSRIAAVKQAANAFVDSAAASAGASHIRIGVVSFAGTDSSEDTSSIDRQLTAVVGGDGTSNAETIKRTINAINAPKSGAGTYPDDGFKDANSMLSSSPEGTRKVVIFFTDGGPGGGSNMWQSWDIENGAANDAVEAALPLKKNGATIYSVGVLDNADPKADISNVTGNSEDTDKINAFMHAVSSNYPKATGFAHNQIGTRTPNSDYYKVAEDAEQLNEIFQDIFHDSTKTQAYGNVSIVDELSQWAQVADSVKWDDSEGVHTDYGYPVTEGVTLEVKDANGNPVNKGDANYPHDVMFYYEPASDETTDATGTVRAVFGDTYQLQDKWTYTLKFDVKPTDAAYQEYATNGYGNTTGAEGTDLYTNEDNTPAGGNMNTSANKPGFRSNNHAYVQYTADGDQQTTDYTHPVLQLKAATLEGNAFVTVSKTVEGRPWLNGESFTFELKAQDKAPLPVDAKGQEQSSTSIGKPAGGSATNTGTFGTITYTKPGTYEYTLTERVPEADEQHGLNYSDAKYTITVVVSEEMKTEVTVTDSNGKTVQDAVASFVNSLAPYEYAVGDHLNLRKELVNGTLTGGEFSFRLTDVTPYTEGASPLTIKDCEDQASGCTVTNKAPDGSDQSVAELNDFGAVMFTEPGTYYVKVVEDTDARPDSGYYVFDDRALYVKYDVQVNAQTGVLEMTRSVYREPENTDTQLDGIDENDWLSGNIDASTLTWANTYVAPVSALPLTGGDMTARVLVLVGSGVLLVAGLAWLLARRRRV